MIKAIHFLNNGGGGTLSVVKNILRFSKHQEVEHHVIYTINKAEAPGFKVLNLEGAESEQVFFYSANWNFFYTCRRLAAMLPSADAVLVAHDWIELGMSSTLGLQNPVVQFLHGDFEYYYNLAVKHESIVDQYIVVSPVIETLLKQKIHSRASDIQYCRFPVPFIKNNSKSHYPLRMVYCVNSLTEERKQFHLIPQINKYLQQLNVPIEWTIIGTGYSEREIKEMMLQKELIHCYRAMDNDEVINLLTHQDIFILPSMSEGFPVSVVEAMKAGAVPLISNWKNATAELVQEGETGFYLETGNYEGYASRIAFLDKNREILEQISVRGVELSTKLFNPAENTLLIEKAIERSALKSKRKSPLRVYGSRLDQKWIPNQFTERIRNFFRN